LLGFDNISKIPRWLSAELRRAAAQLRMEATIVTFGRIRTCERIITIEDRRPLCDAGVTRERPRVGD
jgi:hypothetical protein